MTDIWQKIGDKWSRARPSAFLNEQELHDRIVEAPEMLPLSGQPQIVAAYREVPLGGGKADVLAFEASGRPVVIEVKLSQNAEARRAVVAQALAYAAALRGETVEKLETDILSTHLQEDEHSTLAEASEEHAVDREEFYGNLKEHLAKPESTDRSLRGRDAGLAESSAACRRSPGGAGGGSERGAVAEGRSGALRARARGVRGHAGASLGAGPAL